MIKKWLGNLIFTIGGIGQITLFWNNIQGARTVMIIWLICILILFNCLYEKKEVE